MVISPVVVGDADPFDGDANTVGENDVELDEVILHDSEPLVEVEFDADVLNESDAVVVLDADIGGVGPLVVLVGDLEIEGDDVKVEVLGVGVYCVYVRMYVGVP